MSLLPAYMSELWRCYEQMSREDLQSFDVRFVSVEPESCHKSVFPFLAWECDADISAIDEATARAVIRATFDAMQYAGTAKALIANVEALSDSVKVYEWFEYGGAPYHFKVEVIASDTKRSFGSDLFERLKNSIKKFKNVRSVSDDITMNLADSIGSINMAGAGTTTTNLDNSFSAEYFSICDINTTGGGVIDVKLSSEVGINYPVTDIKIQGAGIWTI